jgi:hypothetical protein
MTWIRVVPPPQGDERLREIYQSVWSLYPPEYGNAPPPALLRPDGTADSVVAAHSLIPEAMRHGMSELAVLYAPDLPLTRRQHEMIATVVSALNSCFY